MKLSVYHLAVPNAFANGKWLLYSTISGKSLAVSENLYRQWLKGWVSQNTRRSTRDPSSLISSFFADDNEDEFEKAQRLLLEIRHSKRVLTLTVIPTMRCNFSCVYCHEEGYRTGNAMSREVGKALVQWTDRMIAAYLPEKIVVYFYGGEPLLVSETIFCLAEGFSRITENRCVLNFELTTNGWFLDAEMANRLAGYNITSVQISLDGPRNVHDQRRITLGGKGTFDRILSNIEVASKKLNIIIRVNLDAHNCREAASILEILSQHGLSGDIRIVCDPVSPTHSNNQFIKENVLSETRAARSVVGFWKKMKQLGFQLPSFPFSQGICGILPHLNLSITPRGSLFLCSGLVHFEALAIGDVFSGVIPDLRKHQCNLVQWGSCRSCCWLPLCGGGCRAQGFMAEGHMAGIACPRRYLDMIMPSYLRLIWGDSDFDENLSLYN